MYIYIYIYIYICADRRPGCNGCPSRQAARPPPWLDREPCFSSMKEARREFPNRNTLHFPGE